jgi:hypothetical protein
VTEEPKPVGSGLSIYMTSLLFIEYLSFHPNLPTLHTLSSDAGLIRPLFPRPSSPGYVSPVAYEQVMGSPEWFGSPQKQVNLRLSANL